MESGRALRRRWGDASTAEAPHLFRPSSSGIDLVVRHSTRSTRLPHTACCPGGKGDGFAGFLPRAPLTSRIVTCSSGISPTKSKALLADPNSFDQWPSLLRSTQRDCESIRISNRRGFFTLIVSSAPPAPVVPHDVYIAALAIPLPAFDNGKRRPADLIQWHVAQLHVWQ